MRGRGSPNTDQKRNTNKSGEALRIVEHQLTRFLKKVGE